MSLTQVCRRLLGMQGVRVTHVHPVPDALALFVDVAPMSSKLKCPRCRRRHDVGCHDSKVRLWRHLDLGPWALYLRARQRRFRCPRCETGVTEELPWAEVGSRFTLDFEGLTSFLAQQANRTVVSRLLHIAWATVGTIAERTVKRRGMPLLRRQLYKIGIDEISYRKHHKYLTLVADHAKGQVVWAGEGKSGDTLDAFLDALGDRTRDIRLVSMDMAKAYIAKVKERLPHATIGFDPFHVIKLANDAVDEVRRAQVRALKGTPEAQPLKRTRWVLLTAPQNLLPHETEKLSLLGQVNRPLYRAYLLKEAPRDLYRDPLSVAEQRLKAWLAWASRSRLRPFVKLARTLR